MTKKTFYTTNLFFISIAWLLVHSFLFWKNGVVIDGEAAKYIEQAQRIVKGEGLSSKHFLLYSTQIMLIALFLKLKLGFFFIVIVQWIASLLATFSVYKMAEKFVSPTSALLGTILFIFNYPLQEFNTFLQTESLFYSMVLIFSSYLTRLHRLNIRHGLIILWLLLIISITRPTGLLFIPPALLYIFFRFFKGIRIPMKITVVGLVTVTFVYFLNMAIGSGGELDFMLPYRDERIICGVPTLPGFVKIKEAENGNSIYGLLYYIINNFDQFVKMVFLRSQAFWGLLRTYYSKGHNAFLLFFFYPIYVLALLSLKKMIKKFPYQFLYFFSCIFMTWITVILTCDDWHNRFFLTISPFLIILSLPFVETAQNKTTSTK